MHRMLALIALLVVTAQSSAAAAIHFTVETSGGNGYVIPEEMEAPAFGFTLFGNSATTNAPTWTRYFATAPESLRVSGDWSYLSFDKRGAGADTFGYILNGTRTQLAEGHGAAGQAGVFSLLLDAGDVFGWYVDSVDGLGGRAMAGVTGEIAPVPLPAAGFVLLAGLAALGAARRFRASA